MGIGQAISRVKDSVRKARRESVAGLGEQLRSSAIPASLRPAATRLADLLRVPEAAPPVSLTQAVGLDAADVPGAHEGDVHAQASREQLAAAGGVCPFSGMNAGLAGLLDASAFEGASSEAANLEGAGFEAPPLEVVDATYEPPQTANKPAARKSAQSDHGAKGVKSDGGDGMGANSTPDRAGTKLKTSTPGRAETKLKTSKDVSDAVKHAAPAQRAPSSRPAPKRVAAKTSAKTIAKAAPKTVASASKAADKSSAKSLSAATHNKKSPSLAEKDSEKVAARPASSKTPARSKASTSKPAAKRPTVKAATKKN